MLRNEVPSLTTGDLILAAALLVIRAIPEVTGLIAQRNFEGETGACSAENDMGWFSLFS